MARATSKPKINDWATDENLIRIQGWARDGETDDQIAAHIGISRTTLWKWRNQRPEINEAMKQGKESVDRMVENALLKRALGYDYDEVTQEPDRNGIMTETKRVTKHVNGDTTAQIFWLKNRKPHEWHDRKGIDLSADGKSDKLSEVFKQLAAPEIEKQNE